MPEYEVFEPDPEDEYYDQACAAAYARMFNEGRSFDAASNYANNLRAIGTLPCG